MRVIIMEEGQEASLSFSPPGQILGAVEAKENVRECSKRRRGGEGTAEVRNEHESIVEFGNIEDRSLLNVVGETSTNFVLEASYESRIERCPHFRVYEVLNVSM